MLSPETRALLTDGLQPPDGWQVDIAFVTTYSLDLTALLLAPMSFALHETAQDIEQIDPIALLESLRRYADRTTVLCQAGGIHLPPKFSPLLQFLEYAVNPVQAPTDNKIFHPKVWVLRFRSLDGAFLHRALVLSRNLTFDRSWDTMLRLDEDPTLQRAPDPAPLARFVRECAAMATRPLDPERSGQLRDLAASVGKARFAIPAGFSSLRFVPFGIGTEDWQLPIDQADRALLISPFLDKRAVRLAVKSATTTRFLSRPESFDRVGPELFDDHHTAWTFQRPAEVEVGDDPGAAPRVTSEFSRVRDGLHAKTFIFERGAQTTVLSGSANLTTAALTGNVEFSVELTGPTAQCGIDTVWEGSPEVPGLSNLTEAYTPATQRADDAARTDLEMAIDEFHRRLAAEAFDVDIVAAEDDSVDVHIRGLSTPSSGETIMWPISLDSIRSRPYLPGAEITWQDLSRRGITPFLAVETTMRRDGVAVTATAVIKGAMTGDVGNRRADTIAEILKDRNDVLRYLSLLLADPRLDSSIAGLLTAAEGNRFEGHVGHHELVLLEPLMRATTGDGEALVRVKSLVKEIESMPDAARLLPEGFAAIWSAIQAGSETCHG